MAILNLASFSRSFAASLKTAEKGADKVNSLSRDVLLALHEHGNIVFVNRMLHAKLSKADQSTLLLFFKEFAGFHYNAEANEFQKKDGKSYEDKKAAFMAAVEEDEGFNVSLWAKDNVKHERKEWDPKSLTGHIERALKRIEKDEFKDKYSRADVLGAILDAGVSIAELVAVMDHQAEKAA